MRKNILFVMILGVLLCLTAAGCNGGSRSTGLGVDNGASGGNESGRTATATFRILWPSETRAIPGATNRLLIFVAGDGLSVIPYAIDRPGPVVPASQTVTIEVPAGKRRLFSVVARKVPTAGKFASVKQLAINAPELLEGQTLAAGTTQIAHDLGVGDKLDAQVTVEPPRVPGAGAGQVAVTVNQIDTKAFPSVLVLEMVRDGNGNPIANLNAANFEIKENGKPAVVTDVRTVQQAANNMSVALVLDRSGSMEGQPNIDLENAALGFVNQMQANDAGEVINFASSFSVSQPFTTNKQALRNAIAGREASGGTALYDAVYQAVGDTAARRGRMAVIAMSDGGNNSGEIQDHDEVITLARQAALPIFTVGLSGSEFNPNPLRAMADQTGGLYTEAPSSAQLEAIYRKIAGQLNGQVQVSFVSPDPVRRGTTRQVEVHFHYGSIDIVKTHSYTL